MSQFDNGVGTDSSTVSLFSDGSGQVGGPSASSPEGSEPTESAPFMGVDLSGVSGFGSAKSGVIPSLTRVNDAIAAPGIAVGGFAADVGHGIKDDVSNAANTMENAVDTLVHGKDPNDPFAQDPSGSGSDLGVDYIPSARQSQSPDQVISDVDVESRQGNIANSIINGLAGALAFGKDELGGYDESAVKPKK